MALDHSLIGVPGEPQERSWTSADALLYAIGVGAGLGDPLHELEFTTENSAGVEQQVLPTFGVLVAQARTGRSLGTFDRARLVHAEQAFELRRPLPVAGTARVTATVTGIYDKGSGALVVSENVAVDAATSEPARWSSTAAACGSAPYLSMERSVARARRLSSSVSSISCWRPGVTRSG